MDLQERNHLAYMFITHDLCVVRHISNDIMVMYMGQVVEYAPKQEIFDHHVHPYTKALMSAIPTTDLSYRGRERHVIKGEVSNPIDPAPAAASPPAVPMPRTNARSRNRSSKSHPSTGWPATSASNSRKASTEGSAAAGATAREEIYGKKVLVSEKPPFLQTVLRATDIVNYDAKGVAEYMKKTNTDVLVVNAGGVMDFFPNPLPMANPNPFMKDGQDYLTDLCNELHAIGKYVTVRVDFRGVEDARYNQHPDWFAKNPDGSPSVPPTARR